METLEKHWKLMMGAFLALVVIGLGVIGAIYVGQNKELKAQEDYFIIEKNYLEAVTPPAQNSKDPTKAEAPKDLTFAKTGFENIITKYPKTKAAQMAALYLAKIYSSEKNDQKALDILQKNMSSSSDLISALIQQKVGQMQADLGKCDEAIATWEKIIKNSSIEFMHSEVKIQQALCYEQNKDYKKAEEILTNVANQKSDAQNPASGTGEQAEKYLRLLRFQKASGS